MRFERSANRRSTPSQSFKRSQLPNTKPATTQSSQPSGSNTSMVPAVPDDPPHHSDGSPVLEPEAAHQLPKTPVLHIHFDSGENAETQASEAPEHSTANLESGAAMHDACEPDNVSSLRIAELEARLASAEQYNLTLESHLKAAQQHTDTWRMSYYELKETTLSL